MLKIFTPENKSPVLLGFGGRCRTRTGQTMLGTSLMITCRGDTGVGRTRFCTERMQERLVGVSLPRYIAFESWAPDLALGR